MSHVGDLRRRVHGLGTNATTLARQLNQARTTVLEDAVKKIDEVLGDSGTEVDKDMAAALNTAAEFVDDSIMQLTQYATQANSYARSI